MQEGETTGNEQGILGAKIIAQHGAGLAKCHGLEGKRLDGIGGVGMRDPKSRATYGKDCLVPRKQATSRDVIP